MYHGKHVEHVQLNHHHQRKRGQHGSLQNASGDQALSPVTACTQTQTLPHDGGFGMDPVPASETPMSSRACKCTCANVQSSCPHASAHHAYPWHKSCHWKLVCHCMPSVATMPDRGSNHLHACAHAHATTCSHPIHTIQPPSAA